jgi:hypothetical protein
LRPGRCRTAPRSSSPAPTTALWVWRLADGTPGRGTTGRPRRPGVRGVGRGTAGRQPDRHLWRRHGAGCGDWSAAPRSCLRYAYPHRYRLPSFTATSSSLRQGPTSPSTSQRSRSACPNCLCVSGNHDRRRDDRIMAGYPVQRRRPPVIIREVARRQARDSGTLSGISAEEEQMTGNHAFADRDTSTIQAAADAFLSSPRYANPNTRRG